MPRPKKIRSFDSPPPAPPTFWEAAKDLVRRKTEAGVPSSKLLPLLYEHFCTACYANSDYDNYNNFNLGIRFKPETLQTKQSGGFIPRKTAALLSILVEGSMDKFHQASKSRFDSYKQSFAVGATRTRLKLRLPQLVFPLFDTHEDAISGLAKAKSAFQADPTPANLRQVWAAARFLPDLAVTRLPIENKLWADYCELFYRSGNFSSVILLDACSLHYNLTVFAKQVDANRAYITAFSRFLSSPMTIEYSEREQFLRHFVDAGPLREKTLPRLSALANKYFTSIDLPEAIDGV